MAEHEGKEEERVTLTIRLIRSFEYRNIKMLVLKDIPLTMLVSDLMKLINTEILNRPQIPPPFKKHSYNCLKIHCFAHGAKTNDTAINTDRDEWILEPRNTLAQSQIKNETEISYFNHEEYDQYKANPQMLW